MDSQIGQSDSGVHIDAIVYYYNAREYNLNY